MKYRVSFVVSKSALSLIYIHCGNFYTELCYDKFIIQAISLLQVYGAPSLECFKFKYHCWKKFQFSYILHALFYHDDANCILHLLVNELLLLFFPFPCYVYSLLIAKLFLSTLGHHWDVVLQSAVQLCPKHMHILMWMGTTVPCRILFFPQAIVYLSKTESEIIFVI